MNNLFLSAISPIDGRYCNITSILQEIFSEYAFLRFRLQIEILWLQQLSLIPEIIELPKLNNRINIVLNNLIKEFNYNDAQKIKEIEQTTSHDIKAIEYFLRNQIFSKLPEYRSMIHFIHFSCTSDDINNLAYAKMMKITLFQILLPTWKKIILSLKDIAFTSKKIIILSRTHGQSATPSTLGKEIANFFYRLKRQYIQMKKINMLGKINGATGNYNAHKSAYPDINWHNISKIFVQKLGFVWNPYTTQIEPHDYLSEIFGCMIRFNTILINLNQDIWGYISLNYFDQRSISQEIGSSTMPHKINPIDFEKSEGNLGLSNSIMNHMILKLPISRWQRDLSDSTVLRNIGVAISYSIISYDAVLCGLRKIKINQFKMKKDVINQWQLLAEPIQTVMRKFGILNAYEKLKLLTRNQDINIHAIHKYIDNLKIPKVEKIKLKHIKPNNYIGDAIKIVDEACK